MSPEPREPARATLEVEILIIRESSRPVGVSDQDFERLLTFALSEEGAGGQWSVTVVLTSDERLRALHRQFMGIDEETDVMTFPAEAPIETASVMSGGDIVVSVDRAADQAPGYGHTLDQEVVFLTVHGLLHLCGWDDENEERRARMLQRQAEIIARASEFA